MENFELIISLIGTLASLVVASVVFIVRIIQLIKTRNGLAGGELLLDALTSFMKSAEDLSDLSGAQKKEYVLVKLGEFAAENGIPFSEKDISDKIEQLIELSKRVNAK